MNLSLGILSLLALVTFIEAFPAHGRVGERSRVLITLFDVLTRISSAATAGLQYNVQA